ncbi:lipase 3-like [Schistocerca serialis cubense]|uniref:lipase 3-like n=1 Tax=Schistocerca serialis cubense TaxID=2023355 RepID=UPI00214F0263|nr:lipase 3-like [Schistocerca serialis cubense]
MALSVALIMPADAATASALADWTEYRVKLRQPTTQGRLKNTSDTVPAVVPAARGVDGAAEPRASSGADVCVLSASHISCSPPLVFIKPRAQPAPHTDSEASSRKCVPELTCFSSYAPPPASGRQTGLWKEVEPELLEKYGYPCQEHIVETEDGYILRMFRIPYGKASPLVPGERKPAVLVQHGLMNSADDWVIMGPNASLAYILADKGYDVWLGNIRGNWYSQRHRTLSPEEDKYWRFSWHEHGIYDMPAQIDYVLNATGHKQIYYIGHSMGTTMFYVGMSMKPEYNEKIRAMFSLAPIAYMNHMISPLFQLLAKFTTSAQVLLYLIGASKFTPSQELIRLIQPKICNDKSVTEPICTNVVFMICGFDKEQVVEEKLAAISAHIPAGSSTRQFVHYAQGIDKGHFRQFDHGIVENIKRYKQPTPPDYKLINVKAPVYLFYSLNDWLAGPQDIDRLYTQLGNAKRKFKVAYEKFNHLDFTYGKDAYDLVYKQVLDLMHKYEQGDL